ncbi:restriction endonuclease subunit S [Streptococcus dentasini]
MKSEKTRLSDILEIIGGGTPKTTVTEYWNGDIPWISVKDFGNDDRYVYKTEKTITKTGLENSSTKLLQKDDIIISARGTVGELSMIPFSMAFNQSCYGLRPKDDSIDKTFLYYLLKNSLRTLKKSVHGSVFDTITRDTFKSIEVTIPPFREQYIIAKVLKALDDKIENNKKINHHLEQIGQELFEQVYYNGSPAQLGDIISTLESGSRPKRGAEIVGIPSIGAENIERFGQYDYTKEKFISLEYFKKLNRGIVHSGDILLYKDGAYTGKVSMALDNFPHAQCAINEHVFILRPSKLAPSSFFLYFLLLYDGNKQALFSRASSKAAQPGLNQTEVKTLPILLPTTEEITKFDNTIAPIMHQIAKNANENRKLSTLRDTLLPKLLSGEISVN